jgi:hypothetical protein
MAIAYDNLSSTTVAAASVASVSHAGTGGAYALAFLVQRYLSATSVVVTYGGEAMTLLADSGYAASGDITRTLIYGLFNIPAGTKQVLATWVGAFNTHLVVITYTGADYDDFNVGSDVTTPFAVTVNTEATGLAVGLFAAVAALEGVHTERYDALATDVYAVIDERGSVGAATEVSATGTNGAQARQAAVSLKDYIPPPDPAAVSPGAGVVGGGTAVSISGADFDTVASVTFGGTAATNVVVVGPAEITCTTPAHAAGFVDVVITDDFGQVATLEAGYFYKGFEVPAGTMFLGTIAAIRPSSGAFEDPTVEVEVHDWMGQLARAELGPIAIDDDRTADQAIITAMASMDSQPNDADFDVGIETFPLVFNTDQAQTPMARFLQKMCRNEMGRLYLDRDGTLIFESRDARPLGYASSFTIDGLMTAFDISYDRNAIFNVVQAKITLAEIDAAATTQIWDLQNQSPPAIKAGQTLELLCDFTDPTTGRNISAIDVVDPVTVIEFGRRPNFTDNDLAAYISQSNEVGGNQMIVRLTNIHPTATGYLNDLQIFGKGIYVYDPAILEASDVASITLHGRRLLPVRLEQITDPTIAQNYAAFILSKGKVSLPKLHTIRFLANQSAALTAAALGLHVSTRFTATESATGISREFYANRMRYVASDLQLWVEIQAEESPAFGTWIWDVSHWDDEDDGHWGL